MNRQQLRFDKNQLKKGNTKSSDKLTEVNESLWPIFPPKFTKPIKVFRSKTFIVQVFKEENATRLSICRTSIDNDGNWEADIKWEELQDIKRQVGYGIDLAVEIYPNEANIVNVANMRHLWIMDYDLNIGWKR